LENLRTSKNIKFFLGTGNFKITKRILGTQNLSNSQKKKPSNYSDLFTAIFKYFKKFPK
jgi:hypothetical protein